jgi:hypothetical protein
MVTTYVGVNSPRCRNVREASARAFANIASDYHWRGGGIIPVKTACKRTKFDRDIEIAAFHRLVALTGKEKW